MHEKRSLIVLGSEPEATFRFSSTLPIHLARKSVHLAPPEITPISYFIVWRPETLTQNTQVPALGPGMLEIKFKY